MVCLHHISFKTLPAKVVHTYSYEMLQIDDIAEHYMRKSKVEQGEKGEEEEQEEEEEAQGAWLHYC